MNRHRALQRTKTLLERLRRYSNLAELVMSHVQLISAIATVNTWWLLLSGKNAAEHDEHDTSSRSFSIARTFRYPSAQPD